MVRSLLLHGGSLLVQGLFMVGSRLVHGWFTAGSWLVHVWFMFGSWLVHGGSLLVHGWFMVGSLLVHWRFMAGSLVVHWWFTGGSQLARCVFGVSLLLLQSDSHQRYCCGMSVLLLVLSLICLCFAALSDAGSLLVRCWFARVSFMIHGLFIVRLLLVWCWFAVGSLFVHC